ncbi:BQ5605_C001g00202 [Microbotryum silenes-dioicae]|uniref:BQ5605_C001g00202 protein n=1 Tax=Microbotryum silenes-dioicae TaxID=796604 RepID=A0A2X0MQ07_9BASI|nr:BQ5605_C001g00202 [Microbotryum silenes-dioicae]
MEMVDQLVSCVVKEVYYRKFRKAYPDLRHDVLVCGAWCESFQRQLCDVVRFKNESTARLSLEAGSAARYLMRYLCLLPPSYEEFSRR